jgi:hypothetical protein
MLKWEIDKTGKTQKTKMRFKSLIYVPTLRKFFLKRLRVLTMFLGSGKHKTQKCHLYFYVFTKMFQILLFKLLFISSRFNNVSFINLMLPNVNIYVAKFKFENLNNNLIT